MKGFGRFGVGQVIFGPLAVKNLYIGYFILGNESVFDNWNFFLNALLVFATFHYYSFHNFLWLFDIILRLRFFQNTSKWSTMAYLKPT